MRIPFPIQANRPFNSTSNDLRLYNYTTRNNSRVSIIAPTRGFVIMYQVPGATIPSLDWKLFFLPERTDLIPQHTNWVAPLAKGFHFSLPELDSDVDSATKVVSNIFAQYVNTIGYVITTVNLNASGNYRNGSNIEIIPEARRLEYEEIEIDFDDPLITSSARLFVETNWGIESVFLLPVQKDDILFQLTGSGINSDINIGLFYTDSQDLAKWMSSDFFWFDINEFYQRLFDDELVSAHPSLPFNSRSTEELIAAYREPFYIHHTRKFIEETISRRLKVFGGIQKLQISIPYEHHAPDINVTVSLPKEICYITPGEHESSIAMAIQLPGTVRAIYRLKISETNILETSSGIGEVQMEYQFTGLHLTEEGNRWVPKERTVLLNFEAAGSTPASGIIGDVEISFFVHRNITGMVRNVVNRLINAKGRIMQALYAEHAESGYSLDDVMKLHNLLNRMAHGRGLSSQQKGAIRVMLRQSRAQAARSAFDAFQNISHRNIDQLGDSLRRNIFERPYFMNQVLVNPEQVELLAQAFIAMEGTTDGNQLISLHAENFVRRGLGESITGPNNFISWTTLSAIWRRSRQYHKALSYINKAFLEIYITRSLTSIGSSSNPAAMLTTIGEIETKLGTLFNDLDIEFTRLPQTIMRRPGFGGGTTEMTREFNYVLTYRNSRAVIGAEAAEEVLDTINARRFSTPPELSALGTALNTIDIVAKAIQLYSNPDRGIRNHLEFAASLGKFAAEISETHRGARYVLQLEGRWGVAMFGGRAISLVRFLGAIGAAFTLWRAIDDLRAASLTPGRADDFVAGINILGAGSVLAGELILAFSTGPVGWVLIGIGTAIMLAVGVVSLVRDARNTIPSLPPPITAEDIYNGTALYFHYFGLRRSTFMRLEVINNRYRYQIEAPETIHRQYSSLSSGFFQFETEITRSSNASGDIIEAQIEADFMEPKSVVYFGFYNEVSSANILLQSIMFRLDQVSGPNFQQSSRSVPDTTDPRIGRVRSDIILRNLPPSVFSAINRIEVIISLYGIEDRPITNSFKDEFSNNFSHVVRRVLEI